MSTKPLKVTPFGLDDLKLLDPSFGLKPLSPLFKLALNKQKKPFAAVVELPYRGIAWANREVEVEWPDDPKLSHFVAGHPPIVGFVTNKAMEIYESEQGRKKSTAILPPGMFFGLFEAYASLPGNWTITSGIVSFMVCNGIGTQAKWDRPGVNVDAKHFKFQRDSQLSFEPLVSDNACSSWNSQSVWLKPNLINDHNLRIEIEHFLQQVTIRQLVSVIRQNPTWGRVGEVDAPDEELLFIQYLDSVIGGHTPIFQPAEQSDSFYLPLVQVKSRLTDYRGKTSDPWDILIPKKLEKGARGIHPVDYVSRFPSKAESFIKRDAQTIEAIARKHRRHIKKVDANGFWSVNYESDAGKAKVSVIICSPQLEKKSKRENQLEQQVKELEDRVREFTGQPAEPAGSASEPDCPAPHPLEQLDGAKRTYIWPRLFNTVVIIEKLG